MKIYRPPANVMKEIENIDKMHKAFFEKAAPWIEREIGIVPDGVYKTLSLMFIVENMDRIDHLGDLKAHGLRTKEYQGSTVIVAAKNNRRGKDLLAKFQKDFANALPEMDGLISIFWHFVGDNQGNHMLIRPQMIGGKYAIVEWTGWSDAQLEKAGFVAEEI